jgi:hypothetical protein
MDIDALWRSKKANKTIDGLESSIMESDQGRHSSGTQPGRAGQKGRARRISVRSYGAKRDSSGSDEMKSGSMSANSDAGQSMIAAAKIAAEFSGSTYFEVDVNEDADDQRELVLPTGPQLYSSNVWLQEDMRRIRHQYTSVVFQTFSSGLQRYYEKDWAGARHCFEAILERFDDGPSKYFLKQMKKHKWTPPADFHPFGKA